MEVRALTFELECRKRGSELDLAEEDVKLDEWSIARASVVGFSRK